MGAACISEKPINFYQTTRRNNSEDSQPSSFLPLVWYLYGNAAVLLIVFGVIMTVPNDTYWWESYWLLYSNIRQHLQVNTLCIHVIYYSAYDLCFSFVGLDFLQFNFVSVFLHHPSTHFFTHTSHSADLSFGVTFLLIRLHNFISVSNRKL
jgi:hypothetical protein